MFPPPPTAQNDLMLEQNVGSRREFLRLLRKHVIRLSVNQGLDEITNRLARNRTKREEQEHVFFPRVKLYQSWLNFRVCPCVFHQNMTDEKKCMFLFLPRPGEQEAKEGPSLSLETFRFNGFQEHKSIGVCFQLTKLLHGP
jgi:hypothetical protein